MVEQLVVLLGDVVERRVHLRAREILLREIDAALVGEVAQGDEDRRGLAGLEAGPRVAEQGLELGVLDLDFAGDVFRHVTIREGRQRKQRPQHDGKAQHELPQVAFKHGSLLV